MTEERLGKLNELLRREEDGTTYLELSVRQATPRQRINCLIGNVPSLVKDATYQKCWDMMKSDAESELNRLRREFGNA